jgi:hypothetical protein
MYEEALKRIAEAQIHAQSATEWQTESVSIHAADRDLILKRIKALETRIEMGRKFEKGVSEKNTRQAEELNRKDEAIIKRNEEIQSLKEEVALLKTT